ncbi:MAG: hypothetical protein JW990_06415, partial [Thermoleophilia bacterium]|nr:hypothetical protein [Thermoleophilia bacterium]
SASQWLDLSAAVDWGAGRAINVEASQPDPTRPVQPPPSCVVRVTAEIGATLLSEDVSIALINPAIDAKPDLVEFAAESGSAAEISVWIEPPGGQWEFETAWREGSQALARVDLQVTGPAACRLTLSEDSAGKLDSSRPEDSATLRVLAKAPRCPELERHIKVIVGQEGLFIDPVGRHPEDDSYHVMADGSGEPKEIGFRVYVRDTDGAVRLDSGLGQDLTFTPTDEPGSRSRNGAEVAGLSIEFAGARGVERPAAVYRAGVEYLIPGDVPVLPVHFDVTVPGQTNEAKFTKPLTLGLVPSRKAPGGTDWQIEYNRCQKIINDFVPLRYQADLHRILEKRGRHLGSDGLYELRHRIWSIAQDLTLGEGGMGYHDEAKWANRIVVVLEYAEWAGDVAFHAATTHFTGPWVALGLAQLKQLVVSAIVAYEEELTPDQWLWQNLGAIPAILEGQAVDIDKFSKLTQNNKVKAWALFVGYHFFKNYLYEGKSFTDSLIEAGRQARDEAIASWLGKKLREERAAAANRRPEVQRPKDVKGSGPTGPSAQTRARDWSQRIKTATEGGTKMPPEMVADIMRDPDAARELRRADPDSYNKYADARGEMRQAHDSELTGKLKERYGREVKIETVGTERGIDRDYHVLVEVPHPSDPSKSMWIEVPPREWAPDSYRIFAEQTGGPKGSDTPETRAAQAKHALDHQQLATDVDSRQACADISDQIWVRDAEGNLVPTQYMGKDPKTGEMRPLTNLERVETGEGRLISGETTGKTFEDKVTDSMKTGPDGKPQPTLDALKQAQKAGESLQGCREGYQKQGLDPGPADSKVAQGMKIVEQGANMKWSPDEVDRALRQQAGFEGGLSEYMHDVSKGFARLDKAT